MSRWRIEIDVSPGEPVVLERETGERILVGRAPEAGVRIASATVSRKHLELWIDDDGQVQAEELGSSQGVFYERKKFKRRQIAVGTPMFVGVVRVTVMAVVELKSASR